MEYVAFLIPVFTALVLLLFFRKKTVWWEYALVIIPTFILFALIRWGMVSYKQSDTEYLGYYVVGTTYYEDWNEYIHRTCTRTVGSGKSQHIETYDCSYVDYHPAYWTITLNDKSEINVSQDTHNKLVYRWGTPREFIDMHRDYYTKDGDAIYYGWNEDPATTMNITREGGYTNKIKASTSIFGYQDISKKEAKLYKLWDYPKVVDYYQPTILAKHSIDDKTMQSWNFMNSYMGMSNQFRSYLIFFYNESPTVVDKQLSLWKGVNMNECNIFIGLDSTTLKKQWVRVVSWEDKQNLEVEMRDYINEMDSLDINAIRNELIPKITKEWHRKDFKDFDYIKVELSGTQVTFLFIILIIYNVLISLFVISNEFTNDENTDNWGRKNYWGRRLY